MDYKYDVFISYSRKDMEIADKICQAFSRAGISYFIDRQGIGGGMEFPAVLAKAIKESKVFLYLASKNSYNSKFTQSEIVYAFNKKQKQDILPYIIDGSALPDELEFTFSAINWRQMDRHPIDTILNDILMKTGKSPIQDGTYTPATENAPAKDLTMRISAFLTGKNVAKMVLFGSMFLFACGLLFKEALKTSFHSVFGYVSLALFFPVVGCLLIGLIRPMSVSLDSRKDVLIYYLSSIFILLLAIGASF